MSQPDTAPDPNTVSHEAVASIARQRAAALFEDVILRDAKIQEQQQYALTLQERISELEAQLAQARQPVPAEPPREAKP